jgi:hypothetical protein
VLLLSGCIHRSDEAPPPVQPPTVATGSPPATAAADSAVTGTAGPLFVLLRTDLGLGDGAFVREADSELSSLAQRGFLRYRAVGQLPPPLEQEADYADVGLPVPKSSKPGEMTLGEAGALLGQAAPGDVLVVSSGYLLPRVLDACQQGQLKPRLVLLLDEEGMGSLPAAPAVPVVRLRYDIKHSAFLSGVAAAQSSSLAHFGILYASDDPQGPEFAKAAAAGAKYQSNGAWNEARAVPVGPDGYISPSDFETAFTQLKAQGGPNFAPDHYILDLGRSTPTIMNALSKKPVNAYLVGAYADFSTVRPARIIGCALKRPG